MQKKHLIIALAAVILLMIVSTFVMDHLWTKVLDYSPIMEENWGIALPGEAKCETLYGSDETADGPCCHIITYKNVSYIDTMLPWGSAGEDDIETAKLWLTELDISEELWPAWDNCRVWESTRDDGSRLLILWDEDAVLLYVLEYFAEEA